MAIQILNYKTINMKVLNVTLTTKKGGLEQVFLDYKEALTERGVNVVSIIHTNSEINLDSDEHCYRIANFSKYDPFALFKMWRIVKMEKPDLILTHGNRAHYMMKKISAHVPVIGLSHVYSFKHIVKCDYIITVSKDMKNSLVNLGYDIKRIFHIPNMLKIPQNIKYQEPSIRDVPVIGMMARLDKIKGGEIFVKAISILKSRNIIVHSLIGGEGSEYQKIENLISELSLENQITMTGWVENKEKFYQSIDIFCLPSLKETFGLVILESFLYSKPVIASRLPGPVEVIQNRKNGLTVKTGDPEDLALAIEQLISDVALRKSITKQAFDDVLQYSERSIGNKIFAIFLKILK